MFKNLLVCALLFSSSVPAISSPLKQIGAESLESVVTTTAKGLLIPGAVVLLLTPQGNFKVDYGTTELGKNIAPSPNTHFRIASNTKTMTAAIILQLAQEGKLKVDDAISKYVAEIPSGQSISIDNLLKMRSGLYNYTSAPEVASSIDHDPSKKWTADELLAIIRKHPIVCPPGTSYDYNNTNYFLLGLVVEKIEGKPLSVVMKERLFDPLKMSETFLPDASLSTIPFPYSHGYLYGSSSVALSGEPPYSPELKAAARSGKLLPTEYTNVNHSFAAAAGGVVSTASDLAKWFQALNQGRVLNADYQRRWKDSMQLEDPTKPDGMSYGYGISELRWGSNVCFFHGGETAGYNSFMGYDAKNDVTLIVWTNLTVSLDEAPTANTIMLKVLDHVYVESPLKDTSPGASK